MTGELDQSTMDRGEADDPSRSRPDSPVVLLVEDESDTSDMYREWLQDDYDVMVAQSGAKALDEIDEQVDVVLLDRGLPDTTGRALLEEIREQDMPCQVVVVSAIDPGVDVLDVGFDDYLTKPASEAALRTAVERSLTRLTYETRYQEFHALATKLATLEANMDVEELEACDKYTELRAQFAEMAADLRTLSVDDEEYRDFYQTKLRVLLDNTPTADPNY